MIDVIGFTKSYDGFEAVKDLSFTVSPGEILGLVGQNGAGKTTTLRAIAGILDPNAGRLTVAGHDVRHQPVEAKRRLAYVPDTPHPFDLLTVAEHLRFTALAYNVVAADPRAEMLLKELELVEKRDELANTLSRGMQQKLAIACAFLHEPKALLLDEPLTGLDPHGIRLMRESIRRRAEAGAAILMSSHQLELVERLCHRVLILHRGRTAAIGPLESIRAQSGLSTSATLEEVFFAITETAGAGSAAPTARDPLLP